MRTFNSTGNAKHWRSDGYRDRMSVPGPLLGMERPAGEPSLLVGALIVLAGFGVVAAVGCLL